MKKEATDLAVRVSQVQCSTNTIIASHVPGPHMWASAGPGSSSVKQCKSDGCVKKIMKKEATDLAVSQLQCSANAIIASHVPGPHMWASAGPSSSSVKQCQREITTDEILELKKIREHSNIKSSCVSALTGSVPRRMAEALQSNPALIRNRTHVTRLSAALFNH